jgi:hypothetical protein
MFTTDPEYPGMFVLSEDVLPMLQHLLMDPSGDPELRSFIQYSILAGAVFDPEVAKIISATIVSAISHGVKETLDVIANVYDEHTGPDRVEQALAEGVL